MEAKTRFLTEKLKLLAKYQPNTMVFDIGFDRLDGVAQAAGYRDGDHLNRAKIGYDFKPLGYVLEVLESEVLQACAC